MPLSWNEIRERAHQFSTEWKDAHSERSDAQTFWNEFFEVFGIPRKRVATFEKQVELTRAGEKLSSGRIDAFWKGTLLIEHKSAGGNLDKAFVQAADYFDGLVDRDLPKYILVSDFQRFRLYDLEDDTQSQFSLSELAKHINLFGFMAGYEVRRIEAPEEVANIRAAEQLGELHDQLKVSGYEGHPLELLLVRLLFCLFADDTGIFERNQFRDYLELRTAEDGSDVGSKLTELFQVLNTQVGMRLKNLDEQLAAFTYINGRLFEETLPIPAFNRKMRETLLDGCALDWSRISPAIFGSLFQSIMDKQARRNLGAHYTRESNILKVLRPLFLDALADELNSIGLNRNRLRQFQQKLAAICILDPACGCGNFLVVAYRELRILELEVLNRLYREKSSYDIDAHGLVLVDVDQLFGIELEEFPAQIAQVALWLTDHQMNQMVSAMFGTYFARLPLVKAPTVACGNALRMNWEDVVDSGKLSYIVGNPPFVGKAFRTDEQKADIERVWEGVPGSGVLDYVTCWYRCALRCLQANPDIRAAFVSTNSLAYGEQVGIFWPALLQAGVFIQFAHRTFDWTSEARGTAAVHCVVIGFGLQDIPNKLLFDYEALDADPHVLRVSQINPYLVDAPPVYVTKRRTPLCHEAPPMAFGSMPNDGGHLLLSAEEASELIEKEPLAKTWLRRLMGSDEFLYDTARWCLWLVDADPQKLKMCPEVTARIARVAKQRAISRRSATRELARTPTLFGEIRQPSTRYLAVPEVSSELRRYIPIGFLSESIVATNKLYTVDGAGLYHFGVIQSAMHMAWMRAVGGRLESRYQYSAGLVYNNFPWPRPSGTQKSAVESAAQSILDARAVHVGSTLADLYDPVTMPPNLTDAHQRLDRAVDAAYSRRVFRTEAERVGFLFGLYEALISPIDVPSKARGSARKARRRL